MSVLASVRRAPESGKTCWLFQGRGRLIPFHNGRLSRTNVRMRWGCPLRQPNTTDKLATSYTSTARLRAALPPDFTVPSPCEYIRSHALRFSVLSC